MRNKCFNCQQPMRSQLQLSQLLTCQPIVFDCVCQTCRQKFMRYHTSNQCCQLCGRDFTDRGRQVRDRYQSTYQTDEGFLCCYDCYQWLQTYPANLIKNDPIYHYNETMKEWFYRYKYQGDVRLAQVVSEVLHHTYLSYSHYHWCVLASSPSSMAERGFHATSQLLTQAQIPHYHLFDYIGDNHKQASKTRQARLQLKQPFRVNLMLLADLCQHHTNFILFDDVYTTGTTLLQAKCALLEAYQQICETNLDNLFSITLARESF